MRCAVCGAETVSSPCSECGADPLLAGRYRLGVVVGQGASGTVYRGTDEQTGASVAVKEMAFRMGDEAKTRELVEREGRVLRQLSHPRIPCWLDEVVAGSGRGRALFLVQEFVEGVGLDQELAGHRWSESEALDLIDEVSGILDYLHTRHPPVIHRDLKPGNLRRRADGRVVLVDFGAVRDALAGSALGGSTVAGTFGYMAPEQFRGHAEPATDLYALGVSVIALLSRRDPAELHDRSGNLHWHEAVSVSPGLTSLLGDLLATDPAERPSSASEVRQRVARIRKGDDEPAGSVASGPNDPLDSHGVDRSSRLAAAAMPSDPILPAERPFEPPVVRHDQSPLADGAGGPPAGTTGRASSSRMLLALPLIVLVFVLLVTYGVHSATQLGASPDDEAPAPPVPEGRPEPPMAEGSSFVPAAALSGTSRCVSLGGRLGASLSDLPVVQMKKDGLRSRPVVRHPRDAGMPGEEHVCGLRFAVDPTGLPAEVAIETGDCPEPFQRSLCASASTWRFAPADGTAEEAGYIVETTVRFRQK